MMVQCEFYFLSMIANPSEYHVFYEPLRLPEDKPISKIRLWIPGWYRIPTL